MGDTNQKHRFDRELARLQLVAALALLMGPAYALAFSLAHPRPPRPMPRSNCKNIATALEMYSSDNGGRYPRVDFEMRLTADNYLKLIPTCPAAGSAPAMPNGIYFPQYHSETGLEQHR